MSDLVEWLTNILNEDEWWAVEASREDENHTPTGEHWQWVCGHDHPVTPAPLVDAYLECAEDDASVSLRSIEHYPTTSGVGELPHFAIWTGEEVPSAVGGHIVRHDPAAVLADIAAKRAILELHGVAWNAEVCTICHHPHTDGVTLDNDAWPCATLRLLASVYADRPGYDESWRP